MPLFNLPIGWYKKWFDKGKDVAADVTNNTVDFFKDIGDFFKDVFGGIADFFKQLASYRYFVLIIVLFVAIMLLKKR